ncbi:MAG: hypothetical protein IPN69_08385 [Acidobacteria bacterium]|nr:hypothetical protein [Acidobacteriota bacterium]
MENLIMAIISFSIFLAFNVLALLQDFGLSPYKDIGMSAAFIGTCVFMFRYFTNVIEKKEAREEKMIQLFLNFIIEHSKADGNLAVHAKDLIKHLDDIHLSK